jgi:hypothetical protein
MASAGYTGVAMGVAKYVVSLSSVLVSEESLVEQV